MKQIPFFEIFPKNLVSLIEASKRLYVFSLAYQKRMAVSIPEDEYIIFKEVLKGERVPEGLKDWAQTLYELCDMVIKSLLNKKIIKKRQDFYDIMHNLLAGVVEEKMVDEIFDAFTDAIKQMEEAIYA